MRVKGWTGAGLTRMSAKRPPGLVTESRADNGQVAESVKCATVGGMH